jgi:hypothetical protein
MERLMSDLEEIARNLSLYSAGIGALCLAYVLLVQAF